MTQDSSKSPHVTFADDVIPESQYENISRTSSSVLSNRLNDNTDRIRRAVSPTSSAVMRKSSLRKSRIPSSSIPEVSFVKERNEDDVEEVATDAKDRMSHIKKSQATEAASSGRSSSTSDASSDATQSYLMLCKEFLSTYSWIPAGATSCKQVKEYFESLPPPKVPKKGTRGEVYRKLQRIHQVPCQDCDPKFPQLAEPEFLDRFQNLLTERSEKALDIAQVISLSEKNRTIWCRKCHRPIVNGSVVVEASKFVEADGREGGLFHPQCFMCCMCNELLVDLIYCRDSHGRLFCVRHFDETFLSRCPTCDQLILSDERTRSMEGKEYHVDHFNCWHCDESLASRRYVLRDDHPYCTRCYELNFASKCDTCRKVIGIDSRDLSFKDKHWHAECFLCQKCNQSMVNKPFSSKGESLYCAPCYEEQFSARCDKCNNYFKSGVKKLEFKGKQWHQECFTCDSCQGQLGSQSFVPKNENTNLCVPCYEKNYADKCTKCGNSISGSGVTYKNENWHRECFTCNNCNMSLAGQRFTIKNEKCLCAECYSLLHAKRCCECTKPIMGISGAKFVSFEDRTWHPECFNCSGCKESLVGKGFITDGPDCLCADCAKTKLQ